MQKNVEQAVQVLRNGGLILYPTDTVWGIGCDATNAEAVAKMGLTCGSSQSFAPDIKLERTQELKCC